VFTLRDLLQASGIRLPEQDDDYGGDVWIRGVHVLRGLDDADELRGDELILLDPRDGDAPDVRRLTTVLSRHRAAALAFAPPPGKKVSRALAVGCQRLDLPLIEIPPTVSCQRVVDAAAMLLRSCTADEAPLQGTHEYSRAMALAVRGDMRSTLTLIDKEYGGARLWLVTGGGVLHSSMQPPPSENDVRTVVSGAARTRGIVDVRLPSGAVGRICPLSMPGKPAWHAGHLVGEFNDDIPAETLNATLEHALALLETQLEVVYARREARRPSEEEFMSRIDAGQATSEDLEAWSRALGFKSETYLLCVIARALNARSPDLEQAAHCFRDLADSLQVPHVVAVAEHEARAFLFLGDEKDEPLRKNLERGYQLLQLRLERIGISLGRSSVAAHGVGDFLQTLLETRRVCVLSSLRSDEAEAETTDETVQSLSAMLLAKDTDAPAMLYEAILEPLSSYDAAQGRDLVHTLDVFLSTGCQWNTSATELGIHVNTLRYRLARIEELTGKNVASMADRVDFYLALQVCNAPPDHAAG